jgi:hypothetical protein
MLAYSIGSLDAALIARRFIGITPEDLVKLPPHQAWASVDETVLKLHMPDIAVRPHRKRANQIRDDARRSAATRREIDSAITAFVASTQPKPKFKKTQPIRHPEPEPEPFFWDG